MRPADLLRSSTFRLAISYMALFAGSVLLLLGFIYWSTVAFMVHKTDVSIKTEVKLLANMSRDQGFNTLLSAVIERSKDGDRESSVYAVSGPDNKILAGNLLGLPESGEDKNGWFNFSYGDSRVPGQVVQIRGRASELDNYRLFVGRDIGENVALQQLIIQSLLWGLAIMATLGLFGGIIMSRRVLLHIEQINQATREIMA